MLREIPNRVKETLGSQAHRNAIEQAVEASLIKEDIEKRTGQVLAGLKKLKEAQGALYKIKPDIEPAFDVNGVEIRPAGFSGNLLKQRQEAEKKVQAFTDALQQAEGGNYDKLEKLAGNAG